MARGKSSRGNLKAMRTAHCLCVQLGASNRVRSGRWGRRPEIFVGQLAAIAPNVCYVADMDDIVMSRRQFLVEAVLAGTSLMVGNLPGHRQGITPRPRLNLSLLKPFVDRLPIPAVARPAGHRL